MKEINTVNQKSLPERTADAIVAMLHMENYKAGAKLPNEIQMAQRFEVSRSTIRLAERLLADRDILDIQRGAGTFVSHKLGVSDDPLGFSLIYDKQNATRRDHELLFTLCDELDAIVRSGKNYIKKDMEFHQAVANCSGNTAVHNLIPYIHQMQALYDSVSGTRRPKETVPEQLGLKLLFNGGQVIVQGEGRKPACHLLDAAPPR